MMLSVHLFLVNAALALVQEPDTQFFSTDPVNGCFGFLNKSQVLVAFIPYGIFASFFGSAGYVISQFFFSPVVASSALLFEPPFAQMIGFYLDIDKFPGALTVVGGVSAIVGFALLQKAERQREAMKKEDEDEANEIEVASVASSVWKTKLETDKPE